jgi:hypothetical protein
VLDGVGFEEAEIQELTSPVFAVSSMSLCHDRTVNRHSEIPLATSLGIVLATTGSGGASVMARGDGREREPLVRSIFLLGRLFMTPGAQERVPPSEMMQALRRHARGDWGELDDEDRQANDAALKDGTRLLSAYRTKADVKFWIITEADRSMTTILLPEEY